MIFTFIQTFNCEIVQIQLQEKIFQISMKNIISNNKLKSLGSDLYHKCYNTLVSIRIVFKVSSFFPSLTVLIQVVEMEN